MCFTSTCFYQCISFRSSIFLRSRIKLVSQNLVEISFEDARILIVNKTVGKVLRIVVSYNGHSKDFTITFWFLFYLSALGVRLIGGPSGKI